MKLALGAALILLAGPALGLGLELPRGARTVVETFDPLDTYDMPTGPFAAGALPSRPLRGSVSRRVWQVPQADASTLQIVNALAAQLQAQGYEEAFSCATRACGGFDFRFALDVVPAPEMFVDLGNFRFSAFSDGTHHVAVLVSRGRNTGYIQLTTVGPPGEVPPEPVRSTRAPPASLGPAATDPATLSAQLAETGAAVLEDLVFATGSSALETREFASLAALADWLRNDPSARIVLVGHTDAEGALDGNIALSRRRAQAVADRLTQRHGVAPSRVEAQGVGFLAPRAPNDTPEGRQANRRVEVLLVTPDS